MNFIQDFKRNLLQKKIEKQIKTRTNKFHLVEKNKKVGLIIDSSDEKMLKGAENFHVELTRKGCYVNKIFFTLIKQKGKEKLPEKTISIADNKWLKSDAFSDFYKHKFDILFVLSLIEYEQIHYLMTYIQADMKVSPHYEEANYADFTFILNDMAFPYQYFDAIKKYLFKN